MNSGLSQLNSQEALDARYPRNGMRDSRIYCIPVCKSRFPE